MTKEQAQRLGRLLNINAAELKKKLADTNREFVYLKRQIPPDEAARVVALGIPGVFLQREYRRYYPAGEVTAQLIGFTEKRSGQLFALDPKTGKTLWQGDPRQGDNVMLLAAGDQLLVQNVTGEIAIGPVGADGWTQAKRYTVADSATWAHPALVGKQLLVKDTTKLTFWSFE